MKIAFVTSADFGNLTADDRLAATALEARGATVSAAVWTDRSIDWSSFDVIVVRSTWDYYLQPEKFLGWIDSLESIDAPVWNPASVLRWNMDKSYLIDLEVAGVPTVPTAWLRRGSHHDLAALLMERGWKEAVVKPVISAAASRTWRVSSTMTAAIDTQLAIALDEGDMMVQPFIPEIQTRGEWSLMFIDGEFSHAVRKMPIDGDFRVQSAYGGGSALERPGEKVLETAHAVLETVPEQWLYARVDGIETTAGFVLVELEMLEPSMYFGDAPNGAARFADAVIARSRHPK